MFVVFFSKGELVNRRVHNQGVASCTIGEIANLTFSLGLGAFKNRRAICESHGSWSLFRECLSASPVSARSDTAICRGLRKHPTPLGARIARICRTVSVNASLSRSPPCSVDTRRPVRHCVDIFLLSAVVRPNLWFSNG